MNILGRKEEESEVKFSRVVFFYSKAFIYFPSSIPFPLYLSLKRVNEEEDKKDEGEEEEEEEEDEEEKEEEKDWWNDGWFKI